MDRHCFPEHQDHLTRWHPIYHPRTKTSVDTSKAPKTHMSARAAERRLLRRAESFSFSTAIYEVDSRTPHRIRSAGFGWHASRKIIRTNKQFAINFARRWHRDNERFAVDRGYMNLFIFYIYFVLNLPSHRVRKYLKINTNLIARIVAFKIF